MMITKGDAEHNLCSVSSINRVLRNITAREKNGRKERQTRCEQQHKPSFICKHNHQRPWIIKTKLGRHPTTNDTHPQPYFDVSLGFLWICLDLPERIFMVWIFFSLFQLLSLCVAPQYDQLVSIMILTDIDVL